MSRSPQPLSLSDDSLSCVMAAAAPLLPERRSAFLEAVARELAALSPDERGPGAVARLCRQLQREHYSAPDLSRSNGQTRWSRTNSRRLRRRAAAEAG